MAPPPLLSSSLSHHRCLPLFFAIAFLMMASSAASGNSPDLDALLKFKSSLKDPSGALSSWSESQPPCNNDDRSNWAGVICYGGSIWGLQLENMGLGGLIDVDSLALLKSLRTLSFMNNSFDGSILTINRLRLGYLKALYLSNNMFSGDIPDGTFDGMQSLKKLHLANNKFTGKIPNSIVQLPRLLELRMEGNQFRGAIPDFKQKSLNIINLADNALEGPIPASLSKMDPSSFSGNKALCDAPLSPCLATPSPPPAQSKKPSKRQTGIIIFAIVLALLILLALVILFLIKRRRRSSGCPSSVEATQPTANLQKKTSIKEEMQSRQGSPAHSNNGRKPDTKLTFIRDDKERFDLQDLLKASAEILGSGCFGSSYKAALTSGTMMVVKRFRQMNNARKEEFQEHMRRLGRLSHPNLLTLVAYYYRKEEKLLVSEFVSRGSLAVHLHSNQGKGQSTLDWPTRLKIIKGVTKGLLYLYSELPTLTAPHGHLKSSNVLLNDSFEPLLHDYGLIPVINQENAHELMVAYKSPEYLQSARITKKTDVWSLGILILEVMTGKFPANFLQKGHPGNQEHDLVKWVKAVEGESMLCKEMKVLPNCESEMMKLLNIGLMCCEVDVEKRIELKEAAEKIEEVKEKDVDDDFYTSYSEATDVRSTRGLSDEINFPVPT
ncbi:hypothetical protein SAY87_009577 [Trapa incisa]|uniref:Protein kinase domain-containing protein n=1 Tax=Trapa incisa TaxID=236973 RepID=A0AAN7JVA0_9MYRT|nr:hypothetical protein SAY87_009577 [Trapa incisa]